MIFSVPGDGQLDLLKAIFRLRCMVLVRIVRIRVGVMVTVSASLIGLELGWVRKIAPVMYIYPPRTENNTELESVSFPVYGSKIVNKRRDEIARTEDHCQIAASRKIVTSALVLTPTLPVTISTFC